MKITVTLLSAAVVVAAAQPHRHGHAHAHDKREAVPNPVADVVVVPGPTEIAYVLNGRLISKEDVEEGMRNGTLVMEQGGALSVASEAPSSTAPAPSSYVPVTSTTSSVYVPPTTSSEAWSSQWTPESSSAWSEPSSAWSAPESSTSSYSAPSPSSYSGSSDDSGDDDSNYDSDSSSGVDTDFPDGSIDCSTFPSDYGAVPVSWMGLGGWTGVQKPGSAVGGFSNIMTVTSGGDCTEGSYCSYACPAGYQKAQWPTTQGATGQSVGGLLCENGKLHLTNTAMSSKLCMTGTDKVKVVIKNELGNNVAVCRTDYPGTEAETVPLDTQPGSTSDLTCPDADNYYNWQGSHTSAQYYVNPEGVSVEDACQWGSDANPWGNYAPLNMGVGYSNGAAWLSIFQNLPTTSATLDFAVELEGDEMSGTCRYSNGQYCGGANYDQCSSTTGCTVSVSGGTATFRFYKP